jgi:hypothetical protein
MNAKMIAIAASIVAAGVGGFIAGRYLTAPKVRVETRTEEKLVYQDRIVERRVEVKGETKVELRVVTRTIWAFPDAGTITQEREVTGSKDVLAEASVDSRAEVKTRQEEKTTVAISTPMLPDWRVAVLAGASLRPPVLPVAGPLVLGMEVDRRILGPFWLGLWANTGGAGGVSVAGEF